MIKVLFMGNWGLGAKALEVVSSSKDFKVIKVITRYDGDSEDSWYNVVWDKAKQLKIPTVNYRNLGREAVSEEIRKANPDLIFSVSYSRILPREDISVPKLGSVNIHPSLLPKYRGKNPLKEILKNRDRISGQTAHFMDEEVDTGDIIDQESFELSSEPSRDEVLDKHNVAVVSLLGRVLDYFIKGNIPRRPQGS